MFESQLNDISTLISVTHTSSIKLWWRELMRKKIIKNMEELPKQGCINIKCHTHFPVVDRTYGKKIIKIMKELQNNFFLVELFSIFSMAGIPSNTPYIVGE